MVIIWQIIDGHMYNQTIKGEGTHEPKAQMVGAYPVVSLV